MPCTAAHQARRTTRADGTPGVLIGRHQPGDPNALALPCGKCYDCRLMIGKSWALRCQLELQQHVGATFTTLTYDEEHKPPTLQRRHLQLFLKRLRKTAARRAATGPLRFFACGEYGEHTKRPHYHAILFGLTARDDLLINDAWKMGLTKTVNATPATIAYTAGYTAKKAEWRDLIKQERIDPDTGEVYTWQPPFLQMSRRPGIGGHARQWIESWRLYAINNGYKQPVPRFLHEAWKAQATADEITELQEEKKTIHT